MGTPEPRQDPLRQVRVVPAVPRQDHVNVGRVLVEHIPPDHREPTPVGSGVDLGCRHRECVDIGAGGL